MKLNLRGLVAPAATNSLKPSSPFAAQLIDFGIKRFNHLHWLINRRAELATFTLPALNSFNFCTTPPHFRINFFAKFALLAHRDRLHDQLHTAGFACPVFAIAVLTEVAPLPVTTFEAMLVKEAHYRIALRCWCIQHVKYYQLLNQRRSLPW